MPRRFLCVLVKTAHIFDKNLFGSSTKSLLEYRNENMKGFLPERINYNKFF